MHDQETFIRGEEKVRWLSLHVLPHEKDLRNWLKQFREIEVDDVVQECYAGLLSVDTRLVHTPRAYLFKMARNVVFQHYRRARIISIVTLADFDVQSIVDDTPSPERTVEARQELKRLHKVVEALPERCRQILLLRRLEGLSQRQVSERLGISENIVEKQIARALRALGKMFAEDGSADPQKDGRVGGNAVTVVNDR